ncbi:MAG TPA: hypothetical protein VFA85_06925 [Terriglobales bacterium]|nr:hypothetical protein [Terriglobales bacterium]
MRKICARKNCLEKICFEKISTGKIRFVRISLIAFAVLAFSIPGNAQLPHGGNGFFGYSHLSGETFVNGNALGATAGGAGMNGWDASVEGKYLPWLGVVADLAWHYGGRDTTCAIGACPPFRLNAARDALLFGPRASMAFGKYRPFGEFLLGVAYQSDKGGGISNSDTTFATAFGGGLDYALVRSVAFRAQFDIVHTHLLGGRQNDPRISTGIVFRF